jgi:preprotein translocase subunit Sec61beta
MDRPGTAVSTGRRLLSAAFAVATLVVAALTLLPGARR